MMKGKTQLTRYERALQLFGAMSMDLLYFPARVLVVQAARGC